MERKLSKDSDYSQPDFYRFSQDSTLLAKIVAEEVSSITENSWCIDIGAGCGVVGFEIIKRLEKKINFDFLEIQEEFLPFFNQNLNFLGERKSYCHFHNIDFRYFSKIKKYSLVVSNPPYFQNGSGIPGNDPRRNKCRFFLEGSYRELLVFLKDILLPEGRAFILLREKGNFEELLKEFVDFFSFEIRPLDQKTNLIILSILNINRN